ncbi:potassium/proton antiporter [Clostridium sp. E02]|uniref:potassium/proton antiporter n=1 Tax=Clostridium sp. E02 TaxID=2487134 RepID=UPI000F54948F|nr:potassium/proton antiporter [Clostridium sp. E02]
MESFLIVSAVVCILCIFANNLSYKIGVPALLLFILLGMMFGIDGIFQIKFSDYQLSENICTTALLFIIFYGGFCTNWKEAKPVAKKAILLSTIGVILTAMLTGFFCMFVLKTSLLQGMLIGSVLGSTDAASVFSILRAKKLNLVDGTASILEVESGSNDPIAYMMTTVILSIMAGFASPSNVLLRFLSQLFFGLLLGVIAGYAGRYFFSIKHFRSREMLPILAMAIALFTYGASSIVGGNGFLSVYIAGILLGNSKINNKIELVRFFDGITGMMQIILFFLLGLLCFPTKIIPVIIPSVCIMAFMLFIARPSAVFLILHPFKVPFKQQLLISWAGLRGAASIVFAIMTVLSPSGINLDIFHIVFCVCLLSVALQGTFLPFVALKLNMIGQTENIFKTFNDYSEDPAVHLTKIHLPEDHPWVNQSLKEIIIPDGMMAVMIIRDKKTLIPGGDTTLQSGDTIILNGTEYTDKTSLKLREVQIGPYHPWKKKQVSELTLPKDTLIFLIQRKGTSLIPDGQTTLEDGDCLILNA